ncbi:MAG: DUF5018 domain-containing protein [Spirochaetaceae bacterium]|nr:DUF5018 domain-containing protein [Spirochaetaceae bacterium]
MSCSIEFDAPLDEFIVEQTEMVSPRAVVSTGPGAPESAPDGYICVPPASGNTVSVPLENKHGFTLVVEDPVLTTNSGGVGISGVSVVQNGDKLDITFTGTPAEGDELSVSLVIKNADDGRILYRGTINIAYIDFDVELKTLSPSPGALVSPLASGSYNYTMNGAPVEFNLTAEANNSAALVSINSAGAEEGDQTLKITPPLGPSAIEILVKAPHGVKERLYTIQVTRNAASNVCDIVSFKLNNWSAVTVSPSATGQISGTTITYYVPYGTNLASGLTPDIIVSTGATWKRETSGGDYTGSVQFIVTAEDQSTKKTYTVDVSAGNLASITVSTQPTTKVYPVQSAVDTGFNDAGMVIRGTDNHGYEFTISGYTRSYDFRTPGARTVEVEKDGKTATVTGLTVVGLSGLSAKKKAQNGGEQPIPISFFPYTLSYYLGAGFYPKDTTVYITPSVPSGSGISIIYLVSGSLVPSGQSIMLEHISSMYPHIIRASKDGVTMDYTITYSY